MIRVKSKSRPLGEAVDQVEQLQDDHHPRKMLVHQAQARHLHPHQALPTDPLPQQEQVRCTDPLSALHIMHSLFSACLKDLLFLVDSC